MSEAEEFLKEQEEIDISGDLAASEAIYNKELETGNVSNQAVFNYAFCLVRAKKSDDIRKGIDLLGALVDTDIKHGGRDYIYYIGLGYYRLEEYNNSRKYIDKLVSMEPSNRQALSLKALIEDKLSKDGFLGIALVGGAAVVAAGLAAVLKK